tara:strand:+ start:1684 stop:2013 length:330 start_codon:yes stop_codon:yes gene_type:complete
MFIAIIVSIFVIAIVFILVVWAVQWSIELWKSVEMLRKPEETECTMTPELDGYFEDEIRKDAIEALAQVGMSGESVAKDIETVLYIAPQLDLEQLVNMVITMRNRRGSK